MSNFKKITLNEFEHISAEGYAEDEIDGHLIETVYAGDRLVGVYYCGEQFGTYNPHGAIDVVAYTEQDPFYPSNW